MFCCLIQSMHTLLISTSLNASLMDLRKETIPRTLKKPRTFSSGPRESSGAMPELVEGEKIPKNIEPLIILPLKMVLKIIPLYYDTEYCAMSGTST